MSLSHAQADVASAKQRLREFEPRTTLSGAGVSVLASHPVAALGALAVGLVAARRMGLGRLLLVPAILLVRSSMLRKAFYWGARAAVIAARARK